MSQKCASRSYERVKATSRFIAHIIGVRTSYPSPVGSVPVDNYDLGSFSPRRKRRAEEEDTYVLCFPYLFSDSLLESLHLDLISLLQGHGDAGSESGEKS